MNISEIKDLMSQFDQSSLREFSYSHAGETLQFSKNQVLNSVSAPPVEMVASPVVTIPSSVSIPEEVAKVSIEETSVSVAEGDVVESPLVGVAYLSPSPEKPAFVAVGDTVKKGQTLMIIEAMKVMNEVPADRDGIVTEILVENQDVVEFGQGLVRIK